MGTRLLDLTGINYLADMTMVKEYSTKEVEARLLQADTRDALLKDRLARKSLLPTDGSRYGIICIDPPWGENKHRGKHWHSRHRRLSYRVPYQTIQEPSLIPAFTPSYALIIAGTQLNPCLLESTYYCRSFVQTALRLPSGTPQVRSSSHSTSRSLSSPSRCPNSCPPTSRWRSSFQWPSYQHSSRRPRRSHLLQSHKWSTTRSTMWLVRSTLVLSAWMQRLYNRSSSSTRDPYAHSLTLREKTSYVVLVSTPFACHYFHATRLAYIRVIKYSDDIACGHTI